MRANTRRLSMPSYRLMPMVMMLMMGLLLLTTASRSFAGEYGYHGHGHGESKQDIVDTAISAGRFNTLVTAIEAAGLVETLKGEGPFTVFAPTDEAFAKIPSDTLDGLLQDKEALTAVLTYHVVAGKVLSADVAGLDSVATVEGRSLAISTTDGVKVNDANVVTPDIMTSNGVIHVIDTVLMPE